jgi:hypothetical protein
MSLAVKVTPGGPKAVETAVPEEFTVPCTTTRTCWPTCKSEALAKLNVTPDGAVKVKPFQLIA